MTEPSQTRRSRVAWVSTWVTVLLGASAFISVAFGVLLALEPEDTEALESPLMLSVARQLVAGPWHLYGPYDRHNTLVMIHSPLYYHLAALVAWPLFRAGLHPVTAARFGGRLLSILSMASTLIAAYRLARLDGARARAGWWAVFLFAALPVVGTQPYAVRPDLLGVALQTTGILWVLSALQAERSKGTRLAAAYVAFALAFCVKLHFVIGAIVCTCVLLAARRSGRIARNQIGRALLAGFAVVLLVYGTEELATGGQMSHAVFLAAGAAGRVQPADWQRVTIVLMAVMGKSSGLIALVIAVGSAGTRIRPGLARLIVVVLGSALICVSLLSLVFQLGAASEWKEAFALIAFVISGFALIAVCAYLSPRMLTLGRLDIVLWAVFAGEFVVLIALSRISTGAWVNYALQAVLLASILTARALARLCDEADHSGMLIPVVLAALVVFVSAMESTVESLWHREAERLALAEALEQVRRPSSEFFFAGRPGYNRVYGRIDLVYDEWLYPVFESIHLAEPRSSWLRHALTAGAVRFVVNTSESPRIEGVGQTLPKLGYIPRVQAGPFYVWERVAIRRADQAAGLGREDESTSGERQFEGGRARSLAGQKAE